MRICVFCSSSSAVAPAYVAAAEEMGRLLGQRGHALVYGGGNVGLMGVLARAATATGAEVLGVIPRMMVAHGVAYEQADRLVVTETMAERKALMERESEAFIALPGGFGTLEELAQVVTQKQLRYLRGAIVLVNTDGFYEALTAFFEQLYRERFAHPVYRQTYHLAATPALALDYIEQYAEPVAPLKWVGRETAVPDGGGD